MKKLIGFIVLLILAGGGWWYWVKYGQPPEKPTINHMTISQGDIVESVPSTGSLEAIRRFDVGSQVSGTVKAIHADYNDIVKEGTLLAEIDPSLLQVQVDIQKANIERSQSDIENQKVQLEDAKKQYERTKSLYDKGIQNQQQLEAADLLIKSRQASIDSSVKSMVSQEASLAAAELNVKYCKIVAPADGVIVERKVDVGQAVQASTTTPSFFIMSTPLDKLKLTANVDESEIGKIRKGMEVRFRVDSYGMKQFKGSVDAVRLNATSTNNVVTYPVWITVDNPQLELRPSMTATLNIIISTATNVIRVPNPATRFRPNADIYTALGLTPPQAGGGRVNVPTGPETSNTPNANAPGQGGPGGKSNRNGQNGAPGANGQNAAPAQGGQNAANAQAQNNPNGRGNRTPGQGQGGQNGQGGQGGQNRQGRGMGQGSDLANMTPEQRQALMDRYAAMRGGGAGGRGNQPGGGGRGGTGAGGRGTNQQGQNQRGGQRGYGNAGNSQGQPSKLNDAASQDKTIDELWAPIIPHDNPGSVWKLEAKNCATVSPCLNEYKLRLGVTDGTFTELKSGDLAVGDEVLTSITLPASLRPATNQNNPNNPLLGNQQRPGGMGGPGGANPGGAGGAGGGRGGGGGGGRGGN